MAHIIPRFRHVFSTVALNGKKIGKVLYTRIQNIGKEELVAGYTAGGITYTVLNAKNIFEMETEMYNNCGSFGKMMAITSTCVGFIFHCGTWPVGLVLYDKNIKKTTFDNPLYYD